MNAFELQRAQLKGIATGRLETKHSLEVSIAPPAVAGPRKLSMLRATPLLLLSITFPATAVPQTQRTHPATQIEPAAASLPIRRVALYKNGVGFFEHVGEVHGSERVSIDFTTAQLNDVLQTLTAIDLGGGHVTGAGYNSTTPVEQQLRSLPLSLDANAQAQDFYAAIRGARVEVTGEGAPIAGRILNVEVREMQPNGKGDDAPVQSRHFLTVVSDAGVVRTVELTGKTGVRLLDPALHADVNRYLQILGDNHREGLRHLTLTDSGAGARELRVSYISEVPVWKSTYRILFDNRSGAGPKQATLQGWAVIDNTVGVDWNNVQLSLIAGAPQSFIQPISQPYYARRPEVGLPQEAQLTPQTHESGEVLDAMRGGAPAPAAAAGVAGMGSGRGFGSGSGNGLGPGSGGNAGAGAYMVNGKQFEPNVSYEDSATASIQTNTTTSSFDDFFEYKLTDPVTILKNQSALVPILQTKIDVDPVTLYSVSSRSALRALWVKNTSTLTLDRGSFSILESGNFSGQGLLDPIHPGERRLLSYAADTAVRVTPDGQPDHRTRRVTQVTVAKGILTQKTGEVAETEYLVHNAAPDTRTVIVEVPRLRGWELDSEPKPEETTADIYRYRVVTRANETVRLHVGQRHTLLTRYALLNTSSQQLTALLQQEGDATRVAQALQPVFAAKQKVADLDAQLAADRGESSRIDTDQTRLRQNLQALKNSPQERALLKRYTAELNTQEDRLEALRKSTEALQAQRDAAQADLNRQVEALNLTLDLA